MSEQITEEHLDRAIAAAKEGHLNGLTYDQSSWCGTACCVLGFARYEAGIEQRNAGPQPGEIVDTPRAQTIAGLMCCGSPSILMVMESVTADGKIYLSGANMRDANMRDADMSGADMSGANMRYADLRGADMRDANMRDADMSGADMRGANMRYADMSGADMRGANMRDADMSGADMSGANMRYADMSGADMRGANMRDADMSGAKRWDGNKYVIVTNDWLRENGAIR